jgi:hypothetical protein
VQRGSFDGGRATPSLFIAGDIDEKLGRMEGEGEEDLKSSYDEEDEKVGQGWVAIVRYSWRESPEPPVWTGRNPVSGG